MFHGSKQAHLLGHPKRSRMKFGKQQFLTQFGLQIGPFSRCLALLVDRSEPKQPQTRPKQPILAVWDIFGKNFEPL